jgi:hypothetical protein
VAKDDEALEILSQRPDANRILDSTWASGSDIAHCVMSSRTAVLLPSQKGLLLRIGFCLIVVGVLIVQAWELRNWVVDDAAISMSYARSLWQGLGLVSQRGAPRIEGFSNPLWVLLLAPFSGLEHASVAVKCLSLGLVAFAACRLSATLEETVGSKWVGRVGGLLLALQPAVTIWSQSGLENALSLLLGVELLRSLQRLALGNCDRRSALWAGVMSAFLALTRPEGVVYGALYPSLFLLVGGYLRVGLLPAALSAVIPAGTWIGYEMFRKLYFGAWLPNTYLAKGGVTVARVTALLTLDPYVMQTWQSLFGSVFGDVWQSWGALALLTATILLWRRDGRVHLLPVALMLITTLTLQVLLPADWMEEHRLATLLYPSVYGLIAIFLARLNGSWLAAGCTTLLLLGSCWQAADRYLQFVNQSTISVSEVEERSRLFERWGADLGVTRATILTADVGGFLWRDQLTVVDLGMLVNRRIAQALGEYRPRPDRQAFREYILGEIRPDFIATRAYHAWLAQLDGDSRFRQDYVPIKEYIDTWVERRYGERVYAGDYVRRALVESQPNVLASLRRDAERLPYPFCMACPR